MNKVQATIFAFALMVLGYTWVALGQEETPGYYLTVGEKGIAEIQYTTQELGGGGCCHADGSFFRKGETVWLEGLDGTSGQGSVVIAAMDERGAAIWSTVIVPEGSGDMTWRWDDWKLVYRE